MSRKCEEVDSDEIWEQTHRKIERWKQQQKVECHQLSFEWEMSIELNPKQEAAKLTIFISFFRYHSQNH